MLVESLEIPSPTAGVVQEILVSEGDLIEAEQVVAVVEVMKMETEVRAPVAGRVTAILVRPSEAIAEGDLRETMAAARAFAAGG